MPGRLKFGTDGWRGIIAGDFTFANVRKVAYAIARYVVRHEDPRKGVIVGYDHRFLSEQAAELAAQTVAMTGTPVWLTDKACPTPAVSLLVKQRAAAGGIVITASHNPFRWSGMKYKAGYGSSPLPAMVAKIEQELALVEREGVRPLPLRPGLVRKIDPAAPYLGALEKLVDWERLRAANLRFLFDPMHGSAAGLLPELFRRHGVACDEIRGSRDPLFGGVNPEPLEANVEALRQAMRAAAPGKPAYDAGFCTDGDGDRIAAMDPDGTFITPHQIFALLFWHLAGARGLEGGVAKTFSVTKLIDKLAAKFYRPLREVPIGFKYICDLMLKNGILIGGEESGGIGTSLYLPERDATVSALLLAEVMAWHRKRLGALVKMLHAEFGEHHYGRVDLELKPGQAQRAMKHFSSEALERIGHWPVERRENMDGVKLYLKGAGWMLVRPSGTEHLLRIYAETNRAQTTESVLAEVSHIARAL
jgi:phosphomannomutase